jgi:hypothetical protein
MYEPSYGIYIVYNCAKQHVNILLVEICTPNTLVVIARWYVVVVMVSLTMILNVVIPILQ